MLAHVRNIHTKVAFALIDDELSGLEDSGNRLILRVEVIECHEVAEKPVEITIDMKELVYHVDIGSLLLQRLVLGDQIHE